MIPMDTQRFAVALATDGDVTAKEIWECLVALGYHGVFVTDRSLEHEHPCPSGFCVDRLRSEGHDIPRNADCCICWAEGRP